MITPPPPLRNIELKAKCSDLSAARAAAMTLSPRDTGEMRQIDTYFHVPNGRLKLREIVGVKSELIWYDRTDQAVSRKSDYRLTPISHPEELRISLAAALGVQVEVRKTRQVLLWHNVRIHLDQVDNLGSFVEFEAVMSPGESEPTAHARLAELCRVMSISPKDYLDISYSQMK
jgi:adenylate cyclase class 2